MRAAAAILCTALLMPSPGDARALIDAAQQALTAQRFEEAMELYGQAGALMPEAAQIPFNMGVAAYRAGALERAAELFDRARTLSADPSMQAKSAYNLGTTAARQAIQSKTDDPAVAKTQMADATESLKTALDRFRDSIAMNPDDEDARANGELAWRWLKQLEQLQNQGDQQQQGDEDQDQDQDQQQDQQQGQQDQQQEGEQDQQQQDQQQQEGEQQQHEQEEEDPQPTTGDQEIEEQNPDQPSPDEKPMSRAEAERLLQSVRDKEAQRRAELARQEANRQRPVDKDW